MRCSRIVGLRSAAARRRQLQRLGRDDRVRTRGFVRTEHGRKRTFYHWLFNIIRYTARRSLYHMYMCTCASVSVYSVTNDFTDRPGRRSSRSITIITVYTYSSAYTTVVIVRNARRPPEENPTKQPFFFFFNDKTDVSRTLRSLQYCAVPCCARNTTYYH